MSKVKHYRDLHVWQGAVNRAVFVYQTTESLPRSEQYGLTSQMRRASVSVAANIAEGHGRSDPQFGHYLQIALGSLAELETQAEIALRVGFLSPEAHTALVDRCNLVGRQLNVLHQRVVSG
jgi:four helix bundle protein